MRSERSINTLNSLNTPQDIISGNPPAFNDTFILLLMEERDYAEKKLWPELKEKLETKKGRPLDKDEEREAKNDPDFHAAIYVEAAREILLKIQNIVKLLLPA